MESSSKIILGATMVMAVSLAIVVALLFVLLAELYCSLLLRRRSSTAAGIPTGAPSSTSPVGSASPLGRLYAHGVIAAPRSFLFPPVAGKQTTPEAELRFHELNSISPPPAGQNGAPPAESGDHRIYISNPIFDAGVPGTPFETPATSPSRLESGGSSGEEDKYPTTPPLTPMKKLPEKARFVSLRDANSSTNSKMGLSSSSSTSARSSPSW